MEETIYTGYMPSPLGIIQIKATPRAITQVHFLDKDPIAPTDIPANTPPVLIQCIKELEEYFAGARTQFNVLLTPPGTPFQRQVWEILLQIGFGKQWSYLQQSKKLGHVKAIRAMASANGKNPVAIIIPCHRVIGSDQSLTGYAGGLWRKKWLLEHEAKWHSGVQTLF
jgi:methylated-DNA-[protein]-cysteine S-methyltransferase